jgi:hypothetical protein
MIPNPYAEARVLESWEDWQRNNVRLLVRVGEAFLMNDGTWREMPEEGVVVSPEAGIKLPREAVEAIARAVAEWQGHVNHADTEAKVLREWLAAERARVDELMKR